MFIYAQLAPLFNFCRDSYPHSIRKLTPEAKDVWVKIDRALAELVLWRYDAAKDLFASLSRFPGYPDWVLCKPPHNIIKREHFSSNSRTNVRSMLHMCAALVRELRLLALDILGIEPDRRILPFTKDNLDFLVLHNPSLLAMWESYPGVIDSLSLRIDCYKCYITCWKSDLIVYNKNPYQSPYGLTDAGPSELQLVSTMAQLPPKVF